MKNETNSPPDKSYDAIEDAIDLSKKDPTKTWDDLLRNTPDEQSDQGTSQNNEQVAASAYGCKLYPARRSSSIHT